MGSFRCSALGVAVISVLVAAQAAPAAAGPPGPTAGVTTSTGLTASYQRFPEDSSFPQINLFVNTGTDTFDPQSGPKTTITRSSLFISVFNGEDSFDCFIESPTGLAISSDFSAASLHLTIAEGTEGCISSFGITFPQTVDVTWTGAGPVRTFQSTGHSSCPGFNIETRISNSSQGASASAAVTPFLAGAFSATQASVGAGFNRTQIQGSMPPLCQATGGGKGAGPGPVGPGTYRFSSVGAAQQVSNADTGDFMDVNAGTVMSSTNTRPGGSTDSSQTTVSVRLRGSSFASGCYIVSPDAFTMNNTLTAASVHVTVTGDTTPCEPSSNTLPLPLTIDVTWTGIGPGTSTQSNILSSCGGNRTETSVSRRDNNSSAVATLSGSIEESFVSQQSEFESSGTMGSSAQTTQVQGNPSACGF